MFYGAMKNQEAMQIIAIDLSAAFDIGRPRPLTFCSPKKGLESMEMHLTSVSPTLDPEHAKLM